MSVDNSQEQRFLCPLVFFPCPTFLQTSRENPARLLEVINIPRGPGGMTGRLDAINTPVTNRLDFFFLLKTFQSFWRAAWGWCRTNSSFNCCCFSHVPTETNSSQVLTKFSGRYQALSITVMQYLSSDIGRKLTEWDCIQASLWMKLFMGNVPSVFSHQWLIWFWAF